MRHLVFLGLMLSWGCGRRPTLAVEWPPYRDRSLEYACEPVFGTRDGILVGDAAPDGAWVVACQSREDTDHDGVVETYIEPQHGHPWGDRLVPLLMHAGAPEGEPIDDYLGRDDEGRIALLVRGTTLVVREMSSGRERAIPSHIVDAFSFFLTEVHPAGTHVLYTRRTGDFTELVERALADDSERVIAVPAGRITAVRYLRRGRSIGASVVSHDTNGNGTLDASTWEEWTPCARSGRGDGTDVVVDHILDRGTIAEAETLLSVGIDADLVRREDGSLAVVLASGETSTTVPASCGREVFAFWGTGRAILAHCEDDPDGTLSAFSPTEVSAITVTGKAHPPRDIAAGRVVRIDGSLPVRFDFVTRALIRNAHVIGTNEYGILESYARGEVYFRPFTSIEAPRFVLGIGAIASDAVAIWRPFRSRATILFGSSSNLFLYDTSRQTLGELPELPYAIGADGRALIVTRDDGNRGPLCWFTPTPRR